MQITASFPDDSMYSSEPPRFDVGKAVRHVTVSQLLAATRMHNSAPFKIDDRVLEKFVLVANLSFRDKYSRWIDYDLDDGTGKIKARKWIKGDDDQEYGLDLEGASNFPYVCVVGKLKAYHDCRSIDLADGKITLVSNPYQPYYHILRVIADTLHYERGPPDLPHATLYGRPLSDAVQESAEQSQSPTIRRPGGEKEDMTYQSNGAGLIDLTADDSEESGGESGDVDTNQPMLVSQFGRDLSIGEIPHGHTRAPMRHVDGRRRPVRQSQNENYGTNSQVRTETAPSTRASWSSPVSRMAKRDPYSHLSLLERNILLCIQQAGDQHKSLYPSISDQIPRANEEGVSVDVIIQSLKNKHRDMTEEIFSSSINFLLNEGFIYTTTDECHFSCTPP